METREVIGLPVVASDYAGVAAWCLEKARTGTRAYAVAAANVHLTTLARHDPAFAASMARFDLVCPDGMPLVWVVNQALPSERRLTGRVYGPTLMLKVIEAAGPGSRHFLLGGTPGLLERLGEVLAGRFPGVAFDGYAPPFGEWPEDEFERIRARILASGARFVWVGLGCPKQENWIAQHKEALPAAVYFGVGAAFAFHAGAVAQAPATIQRLGLEWAWRLAREPRRLWRRYLVYNSLFIWYLLRDMQRG